MFPKIFPGSPVYSPRTSPLNRPSVRFASEVPSIRVDNLINQPIPITAYVVGQRNPLWGKPSLLLLIDPLVNSQLLGSAVRPYGRFSIEKNTLRHFQFGDAVSLPLSSNPSSGTKLSIDFSVLNTTEAFHQNSPQSLPLEEFLYEACLKYPKFKKEYGCSPKEDVLQIIQQGLMGLCIVIQGRYVLNLPDDLRKKADTGDIVLHFELKKDPDGHVFAQWREDTKASAAFDFIHEAQEQARRYAGMSIECAKIFAKVLTDALLSGQKFEDEILLKEFCLLDALHQTGQQAVFANIPLAVRER